MYVSVKMCKKSAKAILILNKEQITNSIVKQLRIQT